MTPFDISIDTKERHMFVVQRGFWDVATFESFAGALTSAYETMYCNGGCLTGLVDAREFSVQARAILERFVPLLQTLQPYRAKHRAIIVSSHLNRFQFRHASEMGFDYFTTMEEAETWLAHIRSKGVCAA